MYDKVNDKRLNNQTLSFCKPCKAELFGAMFPVFYFCCIYDTNMENDVFKFRVLNISFGWCRVRMLINDKEINFNASYLGPNPLDSFIDACAELLLEGGEKEYYITWLREPGSLKIELHLDENSQLHLDIKDKDEDQKTIYGEWHETIPFESFVSAIISEGFRVLNALGLYGYQRSWMDHTDFPLSNLLRITGKCGELWKGDTCCTDLSKEIEILQDYVSKLSITEETKMDICTVYYESWQIQCCGSPFSVGDKIEWTCFMPLDYKNAHGIIIDFEENHHGNSSHRITGTVTKIIAERSEFPKGKREVWYERANVIHDELQHADGWESEIKDDDITERTFWGYIIELKDVVVKPITELKE